jgi:hypothetical protein
MSNVTGVLRIFERMKELLKANVRRPKFNYAWLGAPNERAPSIIGISEFLAPRTLLFSEQNAKIDCSKTIKTWTPS